jgi:hypothetical protein
MSSELLDAIFSYGILTRFFLVLTVISIVTVCPSNSANLPSNTFKPSIGSYVFMYTFLPSDFSKSAFFFNGRTRKKRVNIPYEKIANARLAVTF